VRVLTRNTQSTKAAELIQLGCEVVQGSFENHNELVKAMEGCYGIFVVTNFWQPPFTKEAEILQGHQSSNAIFEVMEKNPNQIKIVIFSHLPGASKISNGRIQVPHMDSKDEILDYMRSLKIPVSAVGLGYYMQNYDGAISPLVKIDDSNYVVSYPVRLEDRICMVDVDQYGLVVVEAMENPEKWIGREFLVVSDPIPVQKVLEILTEVMGKKFKKTDMTFEDYGKAGFAFAEEIAAMFRIFSEYGDIMCKDAEETNRIVGKSTTFKQYLVEKNNWRKW